MYVTQQHYFDGAYSGTDLWSFDYENGSWRAVPALDAMHQGSNLIVTASSDDEQIGYVVNHERDGNYVGSDAQTGLIDRDEAWIKDGKSDISLGNGTVSAISNHAYVGYDSHFFPAPPHFLKPPDAFAWVHGRKSELGHGLPWAVNRSGIIVGDNRSTVTSPGQPVAWYHGRITPLSHLAGSAFGINERNQIVGDIETRGGFLATINGRGTSLEMLDNDLASAGYGWHIEHAYAIASDGSILAVGKFKNERERLVMLVPGS